MNEENITDKGIKELANSIVLRAVDDYREAILYNDPKVEKDCERFFASQWCTLLTRVNCVGLAKRIREETEEFQFKADRIFKTKIDRNDTTMTANAFKCPTCGSAVEVNYIWISKKGKTRGYAAECKGCKLLYKRKLNGEKISFSN